MKVICSKYSRSRSRTGRRSFSKSSSARGQKVSAKAISKRYSKHWSENRKHEEICKGGLTMPYYQKLGEIPRKHHIWFHRNGAMPTYKGEGIAYEHVFTTEVIHDRIGFVESLRREDVLVGDAFAFVSR